MPIEIIFMHPMSLMRQKKVNNFIEKKLSAQHGLTLISLLVGLALSMIAATTLLATYKTLLFNATSASNSAKAMNLSAMNAVMLHRLLSQAGWGVTSAASQPSGQINTDIILLESAGVSGNTLSGNKITISTTPQQGQAVVWDSKISGTLQCSALVIQNSQMTLLGPMGCQSAATDWASLNWALQTLINGGSFFPNAAFSVVKTSCWPFGGGPGPQPAVQVTLTGINSVAATACILNIAL